MTLNLKDFRFLIVDDLREMRMTLRAMLDSLKVTHIHEAKNVDDALEVLKVNPVDIVLCDYNLGEARDGQQLFEEARGRGLLKPHAAWLMITAEQSMSMVMGVVENKPDGYLVKPINKAVLLTRVERAVARRMLVKDVELALHNKDYAKAVVHLDQLLERLPSARAELTRLKSEALLGAGQFEAAMELCTQYLDERAQSSGDAEPAWALLALGRARYELGDVAQARLTFQKVIEQYSSVMEAYDCLARIEREQDNAKAAQRILTNALAVSSRSIRRQQALGDVAAVNEDFPVAEKAFEKAVQMSEDSIYARPDDQLGLVRAVRVTKGADAGLRLMGDLVKRASRKKGVRGPHWRMSSLEATLLAEAGRADEATAAAKRALTAFSMETDGSTAGPTVELARVCFQVGLAEDAREIVDKLVRENHDRMDVVEAVQAMFRDVGMADEGAALIESAQQAIIKINNAGVMLAKQGKYREAIEALSQAAEDLPNNLTVTLNVLQALVLQMQAEGPALQSRYQAREYLARAEKIAPKSDKVQSLKTRFIPLLAATTQQAVS